MIQINQLKLNVSHSEGALEEKIIKTLKIDKKDLISFSIRRQSVDARDKNDIYYSYMIYCEVTSEEKVLKRNKKKNVKKIAPVKYDFKVTGTIGLKYRPVVIGCGPAGLFCAYELAKAGYNPIVIERGQTVDNRIKDIENYWKTGDLKPESNVQFGEGGAGTFSDGKLNTMVKDNFGRNREVLEIFAGHGAPSDILYLSKPHIGTDKLREVIPAIRRSIESFGGEFLFDTKIIDFNISDGKLLSVKTEDGSEISCEVCVLAIGHSARDTFEVIKKRGLEMNRKSFAVGFRVEHPQKMINLNQYGEKNADKMKPADYKLTYQAENGRGVYSFCMCPGGFVVNASSEEGRIAVNGMSDYRRDSSNANSAIIITVSPEDFPTDDVLAGVAFQRNLEEKAFELGKGCIPQQLFGDFEKRKVSESYGEFESCIKGKHRFAPLHELFDKDINESFVAAMHDFSHKIHDYDRNDAILSGVESRTSSPVRIVRDESFNSNIKGIYPCGEGAGYAGGIMSAAMDGLKVAEAIAKIYAPAL
ncbi:MAG: FAD-binding protein [Lachnospiraceae bacterium]|nr:FAD-binding protein [Lachnospiraceae bacterium]